MSGRIVKPKTAEVFSPLWTQAARYKGAWGGRGSGKSNDRAQAVIIKMLAEPGTRVVCLREIQNSIKDSVHQLLSDWIERLELGPLFDVTRDEIRTHGGSRCIFRGMNDQSAESIKSLEGYDIAWFEEAQVCSDRSLTLLRPTIRKPGSEIWFTWNPRKKTDPVDRFLRQKPPADSVVVKANYEDNPWFPDVLEKERAFDEQGDEEIYRHVWLGDYEVTSDKQFMPGNIVADAMIGPEPDDFHFQELILGVDVGRYGGDETVMAVRKGRNARARTWKVWRGLDTMEVAARVASEMERANPDAVFIDETGIGAGVVDRLRQLGLEIIPVNFGSKADGLTKVKTANKRAEMWQRMKEWLAQGGVAIPDDPQLEAQLTGVEFKHDHNNAILLEKKEDMRKRGVESPDRADALALTFAYPVSPRADDDHWMGDTPSGINETTGY